MEELNLIRRWWLEWRNRWNSIAGSAILRLGDASGESKLSVRNSDDQEVFYVRSDGRTSVEPGEGADGEALLRGGGRSLLGNLAVAADVTIDGVDISAFKSSVDSWQNTHVQTGSDPHPQYITASTAAGTYARGDTSVNGTNGLSGGGALGTGTNTLNLSVNAGYAFAWTAQHLFGEGAKIAAGKSVGFADTFGTVDAEMKRVSANTLALGDGDQLQSTDFSSGAYGYRIDASGNAEFNNVRIRGELASTVFRFNEVSATAGTLGVYYSASTVHAEFTTPSALNGTVNAQIKNSTPSGATALFASGDRLQVRVWNGTALVTAWFTVDAAPTAATGYSTYSLRLQSGSTSAVVPAGTAIVDWGTASGGGAVTLSADGTIGSAPNISTLTTAGSPWSDAALRARLGNLNGSYGYSVDAFGFAAGNSAETFVAVDATNGFRVVRDTTTRFQIDTAGALTIRNAAGSAVITMDSTSARIDNVLNIGASGEIRQGTGSLTASPATYTGLRIWAETSGGNLFGQIGGYNGGTLQWYAGTDGRLYAGGGDVSLSTSGVLIDTNGVQPNPVQKQLYGFVPYDAGTGLPMAGAYAGLSYYRYNKLRTEGELVLTHDTSAASSNTYIEILSYAAASYLSEIALEARSGTTRKGLYVSAADGVRIPNGLNVGSATGATTGQIKASAGISATTGTFSGAVSGTTGTFTSGVTGTGNSTFNLSASGNQFRIFDGTTPSSVQAFRIDDVGGIVIGRESLDGSVTIDNAYGVRILDTSFSSWLAVLPSGGVLIGKTSNSHSHINADSSGEFNLNYKNSSGVDTAVLSITSAGVSTARFTGSVTVGSTSGGLNVGSATGAATGEIKASAGISGTTGTFSSTLSGTSGTFTGGLNVGTATGATTGQIKASAGISGTTGTFTGAVTIGGLSVSDQLRVNSHARVQAPLSSGTSFDRVLFGSNVAWDETSALWSINNIGANDAGAIIFANSATIDFILHASTGASARTMDNATFKAGRKMRLDSSGRLGIGTTPSYLLDAAGDVNSTGVYRVSGTQVVGTRKTGWAAATGTATRTTFATGTVTTAQLAERVKALVDDLISHGLIGA